MSNLPAHHWVKAASISSPVLLMSPFCQLSWVRAKVFIPLQGFRGPGVLDHPPKVHLASNGSFEIQRLLGLAAVHSTGIYMYVKSVLSACKRGCLSQNHPSLCLLIVLVSRNMRQHQA